MHEEKERKRKTEALIRQLSQFRLWWAVLVEQLGVGAVKVSVKGLSRQGAPLFAFESALLTLLFRGPEEIPKSQFCAISGSMSQSRAFLGRGLHSLESGETVAI